MAKVFDPAAVEAPQLRLFDHVYTLADLTKSRQERLQEIGKRIDDAATAPSEEANNASAHAICEFIAAMLLDADDVEARLKAAYDADEVGLMYLQRCQGFVLEWVGLQETLGEA